MKKLKVHKRINVVGNKVKIIWGKKAEKHSLSITTSGLAPFSSFTFNHQDKHQMLKTLFVQEMLKRGFLASNIFFPTHAHTDAHLKKYADAVDKVFKILKEAHDADSVEKYLNGPVAHTGFARLN